MLEKDKFLKKINLYIVLLVVFISSHVFAENNLPKLLNYNSELKMLNVIKDLKESLQILQTWFSPSFPVGSFSYSHGLEAMINDNFIKSKEDILDYLKCILKYGTGKNDIILMKYTYQGEELNELALSLCPSKERKIESIEMGNAFRKVLADSWDFKILENTAYPIAVAKAAKYFNIPLNLTLVSYLQSFVSNLINVCIKHIPIGQKIGQDCIIQTYDLIREIEKESENLNLEDLGGICFNSDIYSIKHENLKTRIYKT